MQISQAGRQSPRYVTRAPRAPSDVQLRMLGNYARPRPLDEAEILDFIKRFAQAAVVAREAGFTGVQVHGAHGYLLSSFLSPVTNRRTDAWGGSLQNRARFLLEVVRAVRRAVGPDFPVALKLNSDDFRKGGFSNAECIEVVRWLNDESLDLLELSGGTYEQPRLVGAEGRSDSAVALRPSTRAREAYFLGYAAAVRPVARMPLMVTGGFRTRAGMEAALGEDCDMIGLGRPLCWQPDFPRRLLDRKADGVECIEDRLHVRASGWLSPASAIVPIRMLNTYGAMSWFYCQIFRLADGEPADVGRGILSTLKEFAADEIAAARRMHKAFEQPDPGGSSVET
jgi:2,4-dienoyl-CoA reductase-like NADH-dependent reductase (Old Yellow Enzyme family)